VLARVGGALIDVGLTGRARIASNTSAEEAVQSVCAGAAVDTGRRSAFIDTNLAVKTRKTTARKKRREA
jgi:hypothetical protein